MDEDAKKTALRMIPYGMYVLTSKSKDGNDVSAATVNWLTQTSFAPPLVAVGVKGDSGAHAHIAETGVFAVNVIGKEQLDTAFTFFKSLERDGDSIGGQAFVAGPETGCALLTDSPAWWECKVVCASQSLSQIEQDIDPATQKLTKKIADRNALTVGDLVEEYIEKWAKVKKKERSWKEDERLLNKDILPVIGRKKAKDIRRRDIVLLLDAIVERGATITANRVLAVTRKMFNFAVGRDIIDASPCVQIPAPSKENRRERYLSEDEIKVFWEKLDDAKMSQEIRLALKFLLVTGQRKNEVIGAEWSEFDLKNKWWTIPAEKSKN